MLTAVLLALGIAGLIAGGALLVRGASNLAARMGVSCLIVGLTVVAFGTSTPELVINSLAALADESGLAFGNVVGSNIANLGLVLGSAALIMPLAIQGQLIIREVPLLLLALAALLVMILDEPLRGEGSRIDAADALILLLLFGIFIYVTARDIMQQRRDPLVSVVEQLPFGDEAAAAVSARKDWLEIAAGIALLGIGGHMTIANGVALSEQLGLSTTVVGLAFIAVGTSLPELVTSIIAALRKEPDLSVGNVVGSNIFNALLVLPAGALIAPINVPEGGIADVSISFIFAAALLSIFVVGNSFMGRGAGILLLVAYLGYLGFRLIA